MDYTVYVDYNSNQNTEITVSGIEDIRIKDGVFVEFIRNGKPVLVTNVYNVVYYAQLPKQTQK